MYISVWLNVCVFSAYGREKKALDPLRLKSQVVVSVLVVPGIKAGSSGRASSVLNHRATSPARHSLPSDLFLRDVISEDSTAIREDQALFPAHLKIPRAGHRLYTCSI